MKSPVHALLAFLFMTLFTYHVDTGFLASFTEKVPRAIVGLDAFISWLGRRGTVLLMTCLTVVLPVLLVWQWMRANRPAAPNTPHRSRIKRAAGDTARNTIKKTVKSVLSADETQFMSNLLDGAAAQILREREMMEANKRPAPFMRFVP